MPLQTTDAPVRDEGRMVSFVMHDGSKPVRCHVPQGTLDAAGPSRTDDAEDRLSRFNQHRTMFEAVASDLYDAGLPLRITADHVTKLRCR